MSLVSMIFSISILLASILFINNVCSIIEKPFDLTYKGFEQIDSDESSVFITFVFAVTNISIYMVTFVSNIIFTLAYVLIVGFYDVYMFALLAIALFLICLHNC